MKKLFTVLLLLLCAAWGAGAQGFEADSLGAVKQAPLINDYTLIGVNYGLSFTNMYYSPARHNRRFVPHPNYVSVTFTKFSKMFDKLLEITQEDEETAAKLRGGAKVILAKTLERLG